MTQGLVRVAVGALCAVVISAVPVSMLAQAGAAAPQAPTPRTPDGKPDLTGVWVGGGQGGDAGARPDERGNLTVLTQGRPCSEAQKVRNQCAPSINFERDSGINQRATANVPMYKAEFWERVQYLDREGNSEDPGFGCRPAGMPRQGMPAKIIQTPTELVLMYQQQNRYRIIPIDGRDHDPIRALDTTWYGDAVGKWEGDTLVIDIVGFNDESWLGWPGWFHSNNMRVVETFRREGNTLIWQATVHDPDVLLQPWVMEPRRAQLNPNAKFQIQEDLPCEERDLQHMVTKERG